MNHCCGRFVFFVGVAFLAAGCTPKTTSSLGVSHPEITKAAPVPTFDLTGDWVGAASDGTGILYSFAKDGTVVWRVKEPNFEKTFPKGLKGKYELRFGTPLSEIDIYDFDDAKFEGIRFQGIVQVISEQEFKMDGKPSNQGPRPTALGPETAVFKPQKKDK
jgi:hypothetical protein